MSTQLKPLTLERIERTTDGPGKLRSAVSPATHVSQKPMPFSPFLSAFLSVMRACIVVAMVSE
jgi:hypothetical protein